MQNTALHDQPITRYATCCICKRQWDSTPNLTSNPADANITSTFLQLSPCGHWAHYRCLIWLATRTDARHNYCPACNTLLYHWEGITALTLAARTNIPMDSIPGTHFFLPAYTAFPPSSLQVYISDCETIKSVVEELFQLHISEPSKYWDGSPDLVQCFNDAVQNLARMGKPQAEWLRYET
jgi:hypothetical protein